MAGETETWSSAMFGNRVIKMLGDDDFKDIEISPLVATSQVANEFLVAMLQNKTLASGYAKLHLSNFDGMETPLLKEVFDELLQKLIYVTDLKVAYMHELPPEVREQIVNFAAEVIEQHESPIIGLDFERLIDYTEVTDSDHRLV